MSIHKKNILSVELNGIKNSIIITEDHSIAITQTDLREQKTIKRLTCLSLKHALDILDETIQRLNPYLKN